MSDGTKLLLVICLIVAVCAIARNLLDTRLRNPDFYIQNIVEDPHNTIGECGYVKTLFLVTDVEPIVKTQFFSPDTVLIGFTITDGQGTTYTVDPYYGEKKVRKLMVEDVKDNPFYCDASNQSDK
jgi:hypothetical protein